MDELKQEIGTNCSLIKTKSDKQSKIFNRRLKQEVPGIGNVEDKFILESGYYVNEFETVICKSTNETGKFFKKIF